MIVAGTLLTAPVGAHLQGSIAADHGSRLFDKRRLTHTPVARATDLAPGGRNLLVYVIAGFTFQFGALDLSSGAFLPIGPGVPPDVGGGLVQGLGTTLLTLTFSAIWTPLIHLPVGRRSLALPDCGIVRCQVLTIRTAPM
jgi:hypothetical protein